MSDLDLADEAAPASPVHAWRSIDPQPLPLRELAQEQEQEQHPQGAPSLRERLRVATGPAHRALEGCVLMLRIGLGQPTRKDYGDYLDLQHGLHAVLEPAVARYLPALAAQGRLDKAAWLRDDLRALGRDPSACKVTVPALHGIDDALGAAYVMEGATLGLSVLRRRFGQAHPVTGAAGRFIAAYGDETGARWKTFVRQLDAVEAARHTAVCAAAVAVFEAFHHAFEEA